MKMKEKTQNGIPICGAHVHFSDASVTEIMASLGYDFLWVDMEHTTLSCEQVHMHVLAARAAGTPVIVRLPVDDLTTTKRILEIGVDGIVFPMVRNYEHACELLSNTLYPPYGKRGCGPKGAVRYGIDSEPYYYGEGHMKMCRFVQIEQKSAALEAEKIASIPYLDGCVLGMHDLSDSINCLGDVWCEENVELATLAIKAFKKAGKTVGISTSAIDEKSLEKYHSMEIDMISAGADFEYIRDGAKSTLQRLKKIQKE